MGQRGKLWDGGCKGAKGQNLGWGVVRGQRGKR